MKSSLERFIKRPDPADVVQLLQAADSGGARAWFLMLAALNRFVLSQPGMHVSCFLRLARENMPKRWLDYHRASEIPKTIEGVIMDAERAATAATKEQPNQVAEVFKITVENEAGEIDDSLTYEFVYQQQARRVDNERKTASNCCRDAVLDEVAYYITDLLMYPDQSPAFIKLERSMRGGDK